jgi:hypothetical protein
VGRFMLQDLPCIISERKKAVCAILFITFILIYIILPNMSLSQEKKPDSEGWIQGHVTALGKDWISVEGTKYQFDLLLTITDSDGNTLEPISLRGVEIVKVQEKNGRAMKIVVILLRK